MEVFTYIIWTRFIIHNSERCGDVTIYRGEYGWFFEMILNREIIKTDNSLRYFHSPESAMECADLDIEKFTRIKLVTGRNAVMM